MWKIIKRYLIIWGCASAGLCVLSVIQNRKVLANLLSQLFPEMAPFLVWEIAVVCVVSWLLRKHKKSGKRKR